jgi:hypothetical protein
MRYLVWICSLFLVLDLSAQEQIDLSSGIMYAAEEDHLLGITVQSPENLEGSAAHLVMMISGDTLNEYFSLKSGKLIVKKLWVRKGEELQLRLSYSTPDSSSTIKLSIDDRILSEEEELPDLKSFDGDVWYERPGILFTIEKKDRVAEDLLLVVGFTSSYEYLDAYFKITLIKPDRGKLAFFPSMPVEWDQRIEDGVWIGRVRIGEKVLKDRGTYYFQIEPNVDATRLNGVDFISYEIIR